MIPRSSRAIPNRNSESPSQPKRIEQPSVNLTFFNSDWDTILKKVARTSGVTLVMKEVPPGRFSRYDRKKHTLPEAVRILNRELHPKGFRIVQKGEFLDVMFLRNARSEYHRPELPRQRRSQTAQTP